jgi:hypothetical protein
MSQLEKAKLMPYDGDAQTIEFMLNPTEISFTRTSSWSNDSGNRGETLLPKVNFSGVEPYKFTLNKLMFDTYETREYVVKKYIENIKKGVTAPDGYNKRPPVYIFTWGEKYFHCVMTRLTYTLTLFLANGMPVRAVVDIDLQEVDAKNSPGGRQAPQEKKENSNLAPNSN